MLSKTSFYRDSVMLNVVKHLEKVSREKGLLGETKVMVLKHAPLGEINLPFVASSANAPRCRRTDAHCFQRPKGSASALRGILRVAQNDRDLWVNCYIISIFIVTKVAAIKL